jgi:hypothetical protein
MIGVELQLCCLNLVLLSRLSMQGEENGFTVEPQLSSLGHTNGCTSLHVRNVEKDAAN